MLLFLHPISKQIFLNLFPFGSFYLLVVLDSVTTHGWIIVTSLPLQITRGPAYSFSANISVAACTNSMMSGKFCNSTVYPLSCTTSDVYDTLKATIKKPIMENTMNCKSKIETFCVQEGLPNFYSLDISNVVEEVTIMVANVRLNITSSSNASGASDVNLLGFARHGAIPADSVFDYSSNLNKAPMVIRSPRIGRLYISILPVNLTKKFGGTQDGNVKVCYSMESQVLQCPLGKAGPNCTMGSYNLQVGLVTRYVCLLLFDAEDFFSKKNKSKF